jgi:hypothetical protein
MHNRKTMLGAKQRGNHPKNPKIAIFEIFSSNRPLWAPAVPVFSGAVAQHSLLHYRSPSEVAKR